MSKFICISLLLASGAAVLAAQPPTAGNQLRQIPPDPVRQRSAPPVEVRQGSVPTIPGAEDAKILVRTLRVTGAQAYTEADLVAITGFTAAAELNLADLRAMAARITDYYHRQGYFVAQAYLPAQDIRNGAVTMAVIEGRYGKVALNNRTNVSDLITSRLFEGVGAGDAIVSAPLENRLLLLSDLPGVQVRSTLVPGASVGASDLAVDLTPGQRVTGSVDADNAGNRYTGANRIGATVSVNEPIGQGDVATLRALTSGSGLNYVRGSYQVQVGKAKIGTAYSHLRYALGREFESLRANGTAKIATLYGNYPLIRSRNRNLYGMASFDAKGLTDKVDSTATVAYKRTRGLTTGLYGDHRDAFGGGGLNGYSLSLTAGTLDLRTAAARAADAAAARTNGRYNKLVFSATRLQNVTDVFSLYASLYGQFASRNLDVSEKMELGGLYAVRAYPEGEAYADQGYVLSLEGRLQLPRFYDRFPGQLQLIGFVDTGTVNLNKNAYAVGPNRRTLSGAGIGVNWTAANNFIVRSYYARKLGSETAISAPDRSGRFWIQAATYF